MHVHTGAWFNNAVGFDVFKEQYTLTFPADDSSRDVSQPVTIRIIDDNTQEIEEGFYLYIANYTSLNQSSSSTISDDIQFINRVALVRIEDSLKLNGEILLCNDSGIASKGWHRFCYSCMALPAEL